MRDPDIWWHLRNAQSLLATHHVIRQDTYSFTTFGQSWINPEWLAEIPCYLVFRCFSERGIFLVMLLAVDLIIPGVLFLCSRRSGHISSFLAGYVNCGAACRYQYRPAHHSLRVALFSRGGAGPRSLSPRSRSSLAARATVCRVDQSSWKLAYRLRLPDALCRVGLGRGLMGQHRIVTLESATVAKADSREYRQHRSAFPQSVWLAPRGLSVRSHVLSAIERRCNPRAAQR
jgi:hypothetical protein